MNKLKEGAYVTGWYMSGTKKIRFKGRITIHDGWVHICQDVFSSGSQPATKYGNEFAYPIAAVNQNPHQATFMSEYHIQVVSKAKWNAFIPTSNKLVFGFQVTKSGSTYSFGCGAVALSKPDIQEFVDNIPAYNKAMERRAKIAALLAAEDAEINKFREKHPGLFRVASSVTGRGFRVKDVNVEKIKRLFKLK